MTIINKNISNTNSLELGEHQSQIQVVTASETHVVDMSLSICGLEGVL